MIRSIAIGFALVSTIAGAQTNLLKAPNISADGLFLYRNSNLHRHNTDTVRNGLDIQEAELAFYSDVDPYSRLTVILSVRPEYEVNATNSGVTQKWTLEPEELFVDTDHLPGVTLKLGKFKAAFGKHNLLHSHAFPFVDAPLINSVLLGDEGLNDVGVSAAALIPAPWFSEFTAQYLRGEGENKEFNSPTPSDGVGVARWKNLWDLTDALTMELGASYARGGNSLGGTTTLAEGDLTFKWRPTTAGRYHSGILALEYIDRAQEQFGSGTEHGHGLATWAQFQFAERWAAKARYESLRVRGSDPTVYAAYARTGDELTNDFTNKTSLALQFDATEFSFLRLEYDMAHGPANSHGETDERKIYLQANFTIGAHPAHSY